MVRSDAFGPLPLVIGITGHRDLREEDTPQLSAAVATLLDSLQHDHPHTALTLLSALAEGGDRLVARMALDRGIRLVAPLPMQQALYEQDFSTKDSIEEFRSLLKLSTARFELPDLNKSRKNEPASAEHDPRAETRGTRSLRLQPAHVELALAQRASEGIDGLWRSKQYEQAGAYIARHSQILIALWNGRFSDLVGGTSEVVRFQLQGPPYPYAPRRSPLDIADTGPVFHIITPRISDPVPHGNAFQVKTYFPELDAEHDDFLIGAEDDSDPTGRTAARLDAQRRYRDGFNRLDQFNADALKMSPPEGWTASQGDLGAILAANPEWHGDESLDNIATAYAAADTVARQYRDITRNLLKALFGFAFLSVVAIQLYEHTLNVALIILYPLMLAAGVVVWYFFVERLDAPDKYQDYRALAEGLRVQFFWALAGLERRHHSAADHYLRRQKSELDWIRNSMRVLDLESAIEEPADSSDEKRALGQSLVLRHWIEEQRDYFTDRSEFNLKQIERWERRGGWLFLTAIGLAVVAAGIAVINAINGDVIDHGESIVEYTILVSTMALVMAGLSDWYSGRAVFGEQAKQYQRMAGLYHRAFTQLVDAPPDVADEIMVELGKEALAENAEWVILRRSKPVEVPRGG